METKESNTGAVALVIVIIAILVMGGIYIWQTKVGLTNEPLSYSITGVPAIVSKTTVPFDYTTQGLNIDADQCGSQHDAGYFDQLISKFSGTEKIIYNFKYTEASRESDTYYVTLLPNKAGYTSLDQFKKDFDVCGVGGSAYPEMLNGNWLLFVSSAGSGLVKESEIGLPQGSAEVEKVVRPSLKLN